MPLSRELKGFKCEVLLLDEKRNFNYKDEGHKPYGSRAWAIYLLVCLILAIVGLVLGVFVVPLRHLLWVRLIMGYELLALLFIAFVALGVSWQKDIQVKSTDSGDVLFKYYDILADETVRNTLSRVLLVKKGFRCVKVVGISADTGIRVKLKLNCNLYKELSKLTKIEGNDKTDGKDGKENK